MLSFSLLHCKCTKSHTETNQKVPPNPRFCVSQPSSIFSLGAEHFIFLEDAFWWQSHVGWLVSLGLSEDALPWAWWWGLRESPRMPCVAAQDVRLLFKTHGALFITSASLPTLLLFRFSFPFLRALVNCLGAYSIFPASLKFFGLFLRGPTEMASWGGVVDSTAGIWT